MADSRSKNLFQYESTSVADYQKTTALDTVELPCWKFKIIATDCNYLFEDAYIYFDTVLNPIEYKKSTEAIINGFGQKIAQQQTIDRIYSFNTTLDQVELERLYRISIMSEVVLTNDVTTIQISDIEIDEKQELFSFLKLVKVSFSAKTADLALARTACCREPYQGAPYIDGCDNSGGLIDLGSDNNCNLGISFSENSGNLSANVSGQSGPISFGWQYQLPSGAWVDISGTSNTIALGDYGNYRVNVNNGQCNSAAIYEYLDPCDYAVDLVFDGTTLEAVMTGGCNNPAYTWKYKANPSDNWSLLPTITETHIPENSGIYSVTVFCGSCEQSDILEVIVKDCDFSISLNRVNNSLVAAIIGCSGTPTFEWYKDSGAGFILLPDTSDTINISGNGLYKVFVDCNGCVDYLEKLILDNPNCIMTTNIAKSGNNLIVNIVDAPCIQPLIKWFVNTGTGEVPIGMGSATIVATQNGLYRAEVSCDGCLKNATILVYDCNVCALDVNITSDNGSPENLTANITGCTGSATILWEYSIDGVSWVSYGSTPTIQVGAAGIYRVTVTCGDCEVKKGHFVCESMQNCFFGGQPNNIAVCDSVSCPKQLRVDLLTMADVGGSFNWLGYSNTINGSYSTSNGTNPGSLIGDNPTINFSAFITGFYKFEYAPPPSATCGNAVPFIVPVMAAPNSGSNGSFSECEKSNNSIDLFSKLGGSPQTGGTWTIVSGNPPTGSADLVNGIFTINNDVLPSTYVFKYTVSAPIPPSGYTLDCSLCVSDDSGVTITVTDTPSSGAALNISNCN